MRSSSPDILSCVGWAVVEVKLCSGREHAVRGVRESEASDRQ